MTALLLLTNARIPGREALVEISVESGVIRAISAAGAAAASGAAAAETVDLQGRWVIPGLWDHHVHFAQWVTQQQRLDLSGASSAAEVLDLVRGALPVTGSGPLVGYGFRDGLWPDAPSTASLDEVAGGHPTVLVSGDLHCAWLSTAAQQMLQVTSGSDGLVKEEIWFAALEQLQNATDLSTEQYRAAAEAAAARGVVGVVEYENTENIELWPRRTAEGVDQLRVQVSVWPDKLESAVAREIKTGDVLDERGLITMGPLKVVVDGSLNTRTAWCWDPYPGMDPAHPHACGTETVPLDELHGLMSRAREAGIAAAIHAIGDRANTAVLDAFETLGMTGVIEHAQLLREEDVPRFAALGLAASVQPEHAMDDRDVADAYWAGRTGRAFALRSLHEAGVQLRMGSDAPVSPLDPWRAIASATHRSRGDREPWHPEQSIDLPTALAASTGGRTEVQVGDVADIAVLDRDPYACDRDELRTMPVAATLLGGRFTHRAL